MGWGVVSVPVPPKNTRWNRDLHHEFRRGSRGLEPKGLAFLFEFLLPFHASQVRAERTRGTGRGIPVAVVGVVRKQRVHHIHPRFPRSARKTVVTVSRRRSAFSALPSQEASSALSLMLR